MFQVIIINGCATAGKDTFIDLFTEEFKNAGYSTPVYRISSVDKVKEIAKSLGWDGVKDDKGRQFLSDLKDAMTAYNDAPFTYTVKSINSIRNATKGNAIIFVHVREPEEIKKYRDRSYSKAILVRRDEVTDVFSNHADKEVFGYQYDFIVDNNGTLDDLRNAAKGFVHLLEYWRSLCHQ